MYNNNKQCLLLKLQWIKLILIKLSCKLILVMKLIYLTNSNKMTVINQIIMIFKIKQFLTTTMINKILFLMYKNNKSNLCKNKMSLINQIIFLMSKSNKTNLFHWFLLIIFNNSNKTNLCKLIMIKKTFSNKLILRSLLIH